MMIISIFFLTTLQPYGIMKTVVLKEIRSEQNRIMYEQTGMVVAHEVGMPYMMDRAAAYLAAVFF